MQGRGKREYPEKTHRQTVSSSLIPTCDNPGVNPPGIEPGSPWWEASEYGAAPVNKGEGKREISEKTPPTSGITRHDPHMRKSESDPAGNRTREEIRTALNIEVLRADEGVEVSMEQHRNERAGETGDPRENSPTNGIVRHDSHMRKSGVTRPGIEPGSPWWDVSRLTAQPPRLLFFHGVQDNPANMVQQRRNSDGRKREHFEKAPVPQRQGPPRSSCEIPRPKNENWDVTVLGSRPWRLDCSPPTMEDRVQSLAGSLPIFASGNRAGLCRWSASFLGDLSFPPPFHTGAAPCSPQSLSSALKISLLKATQISLLSHYTEHVTSIVEVYVTKITFASLSSPVADLPREALETVLVSGWLLRAAEDSLLVGPPSGTLVSRRLLADDCRTKILFFGTVRLLASHHGEPGSIPGLVTPGFSHVGIVSGDDARRWIFSEISHFPRPCILALLHPHLISPSSILKASSLRAARISQLSSTKLYLADNYLNLSGDLPFPPPLHSGAAPYSLQPPSSAVETSLRSVFEYGTAPGGRGKREIPEQSRRPAASSDTIPLCENLEAIPPGNEPGSPWWEAGPLRQTRLLPTERGGDMAYPRGRGGSINSSP
ncbi:hypothetical protein PR048_030267 [Dryococelus australis]|uniref:Uncharacterized protein n=1 Tax=Dryococelus australis TaxID=614101 RepID=A0ABQ9G8Z6_9NEOP|nr:hypothetical protein PR048_030267 [Dryococelus australis]